MMRDLHITLSWKPHIVVESRLHLATPDIKNVVSLTKNGPDHYFVKDTSVTQINLQYWTVLYIDPISKEPETKPLKASLEQNYPNPFNPATTIRYSLSKPAHVRLTVYNILGQRVAALVDRKEAAGHYQVTFDAGRLASGVYIYRLQAGNYVKTWGMTLLKRWVILKPDPYPYYDTTRT